jgi:N-acetylmuramoyl-L-alanine amidase
MQRTISALIFPVLMLLLLPGVYSQEKTSIRKVVIDAGHGGKDPGTIGLRTQEKNVNLAIALKVGALIRKNNPDVTVIFTREKDEFIELFERAEIANRNNADLFISIHCNANRSHMLHGAATYIMGLHKSLANLDIAKQENASILMEPNYTTHYDGFDPNSDESYITFSLFQNAFLNQSTEFAADVQDQLKDRVGLNDKGVRQAGFLVLYKTTMPSVLVETGFLSNPEEEKFLASDKGQEYIAAAIDRAFRAFREKLEKGAAKGTQLASDAAKKNITHDGGGGDPGSVTVPEPVHGQQSPVPAVKKESKPAENKPSVPKEQKPAAVKQPAPASPTLAYRIQVAAYSKDVGVKSPKFKGLENVKMYRHQGMFKYTTGSVPTLDEALVLLDVIQKKGFPDAFVVAFKGDERITIAEAKSLQGGNK